MHDSFLHPLLRLVIAIFLYIYIFPDTVFSNSPMSRFISPSYCTNMESLKYVFSEPPVNIFPRKCKSHLAITTFIVNGYHKTWQSDDCSEVISWCSWLGWPLSELQPYVHSGSECQDVHDWEPIHIFTKIYDSVLLALCDAELWCSLCCQLVCCSTNSLVALPVILDAMTLMWHHSNEYDIHAKS